MKNFFFFILMLIFFLSGASDAFTAGIFENTNQSAEFIRSLNRNASTEIDAAFYNPAGTAFMKDGIYFYLSDQMIFDYQTINDTSPGLAGYNFPKEYKGNAFTWGFPDIYALYKKDQMAGFFNLGFIGRGALSNYPDGLPGINKAVTGYAMGVIPALGMGDVFPYVASINASQKIDAYSTFLGFTLGGSYAFNDMFSAGLGLRYIYGIQNTKLKYNINSISGTVSSSAALMATHQFDKVNIDIDSEGHSFGGVGGVDIKPSKEMNIGFRVEYYSKMKMKNKSPNTSEGPAGLIAQLPGFREGDEQYTTLPPVTALGISYMIMPKLKAETSLTYFWNKYANWGKDGNGKEVSKKYDNGYDTGLSLEYTIMPELRGSIGYTYSMSGINSKVRSESNIGLPSHAVGLGASYVLNEKVNLTAALMSVFFVEQSVNNEAPDSGKQTFKETVYNVALSASYKL